MVEKEDLIMSPDTINIVQIDTYSQRSGKATLRVMIVLLILNFMIEWLLCYDRKAINCYYTAIKYTSGVVVESLRQLISSPWTKIIIVVIYYPKRVETSTMPKLYGTQSS